MTNYLKNIKSCELFPLSPGRWYSERFGNYIDAELNGDYIILIFRQSSVIGICSIIQEYLKEQLGRSGEFIFEYGVDGYKIKIPYERGRDNGND